MTSQPTGSPHTFRIAAIPADGVGKEVVAAGRAVLDALAQRSEGRFAFSWPRAGVDPVLPALAATFAASFSYMLPIATPQNAIVYGTGCVPILSMVRTGLVLNVLGFLLLVTLLPLSAGMVGIGS